MPDPITGVNALTLELSRAERLNKPVCVALWPMREAEIQVDFDEDRI